MHMHRCVYTYTTCMYNTCNSRQRKRRNFERKDKGESRERCLLNTNIFTSSSSSSDIHFLRLLLELQSRPCVYCYFNLCDYVRYISSTPVSKSLWLWVCRFMCVWTLNLYT